VTCSRGPDGRRQRPGETVIVVATPGGGRTFITRQRSRKELASATTAIELTTTSHCVGLTTTTSLTPRGSPSSGASDASTPLVHGQHAVTDVADRSAFV